MKSTGIVRACDENGRLVLPIEIRKQFGINEKGGSLSIYVDNDSIVLKKYEPACIFCNSADDLILYEGRLICSECAKKIGAKAN